MFMRYPLIIPFWSSTGGGIQVKKTEWEVISATVTLPGAALGTKQERTYFDHREDLFCYLKNAKLFGIASAE